MSVYGLAFRKKVVAAWNDGETVLGVARRFQIDPKTVRSYRKLAAQGLLAPAPAPPREPRSLTPADLQTLRDAVATQNDQTLEELRDQLSVKVHVTTVHRALKRLNLSFKKNR